ncbi:LLM class flavin-dependent oxidoreductase [Streptomyces sparsogenes]|uniref:LLM class flavin-dependent oxidoreductase n=1 Tax=Streptomyces sparsogenes TaxID=67365 RepID=UPI0033DD0D33
MTNDLVNGRVTDEASPRRRVGVMFDRDRRPEELAGYARAVEEAGADDLWVVDIDGVRPVPPPAEAPPVVSGVVRPRSLELSGRAADGTVMAEGQGPDAVAAALGHIARGRAAAGATRPHERIVFTHLCVADDPWHIATATAPVRDEYSEWLGVPPEEVFLAAGDAATAPGRVRELWEAGAETVVLRPVGEEPLAQVRAALEALAVLER